MTIRNEVNFAIVPEWVLFSGVSANAVRLYAILNRHADKAGRCHPGRRRLADLLLAKSDRTVDRALDELKAIGAVKVTARFDRRGDQTSNQYVVMVTPDGAAQLFLSPQTPLSEIARGGDTDVPTPLAADVAQNESHIELDTPLPPHSGGSKRTRRTNPRATGTSPRQRARKAETDAINDRLRSCPECGDNPNVWCDRCTGLRRKLSELVL